ncbi:hypothetical protein [Formosa sp. A9]|uniref:hypothetical protein n=1 Tax=Formosa sp. A9 TaxID=3442641 RepID=UPI003EB7D73D
MSKDQVFEKQPSLERYFKTSDGKEFYKHHHAKMHADGLKDKKIEEVVNPSPKPIEVSTPQAKTVANANANEELTPMQKAQLRVDAINAMQTVDEVESALVGETAKTVKAAGEERIKALQASKANDADKKDAATEPNQDKE